MKTVMLNNGVQMPILGFGVFQITDPVQCEQCVAQAIASGYRLIDTAASYGNEQAVGRAIQRSGVSREELFITTKLWVSDAGYEATQRAFYQSLERLGLDYLDLYLIHQPFGDVYGAWRAMEELYKKGVVRAIGVSNFHPDRVMDLMCHNEIVPAVNQIEINPFCQQVEALAFLAGHGVHPQSWAPFAEGRNGLFEHPTLVSIAQKYQKTVAQVVLRWLIEQHVSVLPKSVHPERMVENSAVLDFELSADDRAQIALLDQKQSMFFDHHNPEIVQWICNLHPKQ